jgi:Tol biopolymer transport system component
MTRRRTLYLPVMIAAAVSVACLVALLAVSQKSEAAFPGQNGRIAYFDRGPGLEDDEIYSMNPDGTGREQLTDNSAHDQVPDISPDGTKIAFESLRSGINKLYVMKADGTAVRNLSGSRVGESSPAWSPDGTMIAFEKKSDIWVMDADGSNRKNLTKTGPVDGYSITESEPSWSPDGTKIAFYKRNGRPNATDLYTINVEGTKLRQVTDYPGSEYSPDWSPSGHRLTYVRSARVQGARIFTIRADGTGKRLIAQDGESPVFSPDGKRIAFTREGDLYKVKSDGSGEPSVVDEPADSGESEPDGDRGPLLLRGSP